MHTFLPKQIDIDKILEIIQRKLLKGTHLPVEVKEIQVGYLHSPYFKDLYQYLLQNKLQSSKFTIKEITGNIRKVCIVRFFVIQDMPRKGNSSSSNTRDVHGQDNNLISQKSVSRTSRSN